MAPNAPERSKDYNTNRQYNSNERENPTAGHRLKDEVVRILADRSRRGWTVAISWLKADAATKDGLSRRQIKGEPRVVVTAGNIWIRPSSFK